jgi:hypothetical protein
MKITKKHISDNELDSIIVTAEVLLKEKRGDWYECILKAALELKQRRAEERQSEAKNGL